MSSQIHCTQRRVPSTITATGDTVGYGGGFNGFAAQWGHFPAQGLTLRVMANTEGPAALRVAGAIARLLLGVAPATEPMDVTLTAEARRPYIGTYEIGTYDNGTYDNGTYDNGALSIRVFSREGAHRAQRDGQPAFRLLGPGMACV